MVVVGAEVEPERRGRYRGQSESLRQNRRTRQIRAFGEARRKTEDVETTVFHAEQRQTPLLENSSE